MNPRRTAALVATVVLAALPALARVEVTLDADSLNDMLASMAPDHVQVALGAGRGVTIQMLDLKVTGFDPTAGPNGGLMTSLRLVVPELGIDVPVAPHLTLDMTDGAGGKKACVLRFDRVVLNLPLTGSIDVAALLPTLPVMPETAWTVNSARGKVRVTPSLVDAKTGTKNIRLGFDLAVAPAAETK
jgi:hypothetical protein